MEKFKNIEFLRIIGCIAIVFLHIFHSNGGLYELFGNITYGQLYFNTSNGQKAVDLFFILSGLFFTLKIAPPPKMQSLYDFIKKKVLRLWPVLMWVILLYFAASFSGAVKFFTLGNIITILGLNGTGIGLHTGNVGVFWYVSAMLWVLIFYFYLLKNFDKKIVNLIIALLIYFSYAFILNARHGSIANQRQTFYYIFNIGMLRAFGGIGIGYLIGEWYKNNKDKIKNMTLSFKNTIIISVLEFGCLFFIIKNLMFNKLHFNNQFIFIIFFMVIIILFLINKGYISKALNNNFSVFLGKYTYSIYMTHTLINKLFKETLWKHHPEFVLSHPILNIVITLGAIFLFGIFTYHFVEKPVNDYITKNSRQNCNFAGYKIL